MDLSPAPGAKSEEEEANVLTVYGAEWCEDTQRSLRHLRRIGVDHEYFDVDADEAALARAKSLNNGRRRTPVIEIGDEVLVEPGIGDLTEALIRNEMLAREAASERLDRVNVGDLERGVRIGVGLGLGAAAFRAPNVLKVPLIALGVFEMLSGIFAWCPVYSALGVTSLGGPLDHPMEAERESWLVSATELTGGATAVASGEARP